MSMAQTTQTAPAQNMGAPGFRADAPERRGPPPWRGMGPMGGGPLGAGPPGARAFSSKPWHEIDTRLLECRRKFDDNLAQRDKLIEQLAEEKKHYQPDAVDPASVLQHKAIDKLMGDLHQVVEAGREGVDEAADLVGTALLTRNVWEPALRREPDGSASERPAVPRRKAWLAAVARLDREGPEGFARELLGDRFGVEAFQGLPERLRRPGPPWGHEGGAPSPMRRQLLDSIRQNWLGRIERMEKQQEDLRRELQRQERELLQMRLVLENVLNEPEPAEPADAAK